MMPLEIIRILSGPCAEVEKQLNELMEHYAIANFAFSENGANVTASALLVRRQPGSQVQVPQLHMGGKAGRFN